MPGGWLGALVRGRTVEWLVLRDAQAVLDASTATLATAVDAPIGLAEAGPRACDLAARRVLGRRGVTVFPAPVRAVLGATSYEEACALSRAAQGRALSLQAWHITDKIADLDSALDGRVDAVVECHPEIAFAAMAGVVLPPKRTAAGVDARVVALTSFVDDVARLVRARPRGASVDDALDALACAWTARRISRGEAQRLPEGRLERDRLGRPMQIVF